MSRVYSILPRISIAPWPNWLYEDSGHPGTLRVMVCTRQGAGATGGLADVVPLGNCCAGSVRMKQFHPELGARMLLHSYRSW